MKLIQTTDFFYPLIDDPYTMGWITCCNVLSDLYAMGVIHCDNMLSLLCVAQDMDAQEREVCIRMVLQGFRDCATEAGTSVCGGQTIRGPWLMIGGVATSVCSDDEYIMPNQAVPGDKLILTKPLGTQVAVNVRQWMLEEHANWNDKLHAVVTPDEVLSLFHAATLSMTHLNKSAATLMHKYRAHACTDVTGFGLMGHAENLAKFQRDPYVAFEIRRMPYLAGCVELSMALNDRFKLRQGLSPETSGGLLIAMPPDDAERFCSELTELEGCPAWIVGEVVESDSRKAFLSEELEYVRVNHSSVKAPKVTSNYYTPPSSIIDGHH